MKKDENLFIKLGLEKNQLSGEITLNIQFDNNAPNFTKDKDITIWRPTVEEWSYANEAFDMLLKGQSYKHGKKSGFEQTENDDQGFIPQTNEHEIVDKFLEKNEKV